MKRHTPKALARAARVEPLERRALLSLSPIGAEFPVNSVVANAQQVPAVASDGDGDFVVVWEGNGPGDIGGVFARRYNAAGVAQGTEFRVNSTTEGFQGQPAVAMDADGDFVVVWAGNGPGDNAGVFAQRFNAVGVAQGGEFRVNTFTTSGQALPAVAMDAAGNFAIVWSSLAQDGSGSGVYLMPYLASGEALRLQDLKVNTHTALDQTSPTIAAAASRGFTVAWTSVGQDGAGDGIYAQRVSPDGIHLSSEFRVNTFTAGNQAAPAIAMNASGDFVIAWHSSGQDAPETFSVYAQRYNAAGAPQSGESVVNTTAAGHQLSPSTAMDADGDFLVAWTSYGQDGSDAGVYGRNFNAAGVPQTDEFRVNTFTTNAQSKPAVAMDADGDAVVVWESNLQDGSGQGVYAQRYNESTELAGPILSGLSVDLIPIAPGERVVQSVPALVLNFSEELSIAGGTAGANSAINPQNYILTRNGVDVSALITSVNFGLNAASAKYQTILNFSAPLADGNYIVTTRQSLRDLAGNALDGDLDGVPGGGNASISFSVFPQVKVGPQVHVNTFVAGVQEAPAVAMDANGNYLVTWQSFGQDGSDLGIFGQRYSAAGQPAGSEFPVNTTTFSAQVQPAIAMSRTGLSVIAWDGAGNGDGDGIFFRRAFPTPFGDEVRANTTTAGIQRNAAVAMDREGNFVIVWDGNGPGDAGGIFAQRYSSSGLPRGSEFRVNTVTSGSQRLPSVGMDDRGNFVIGWVGGIDPDGTPGAYAQRFNPDGVPLGGEFQVNTITVGTQSVSAVAMYPAGEFLILWRDNGGSPDSDGLFVQRYNAAGQRVGNNVRAHTTTAGTQDQGAVAIDASGDFVVTWRSIGQDVPNEPTNGGIYAQRFNAAGGKEGPEFGVNTFVFGAQDNPAVAMGSTGDFVIAWSGQGTTPLNVFAQRYAANEAPTTSGIPPVNVPQDSQETVIPLGNLFSDSTDPDSLLTFDVMVNTNPALVTATTQNPQGLLTLQYTPGVSGQALITIRCTDTGGLFVETTFTVTVIPPLTVCDTQFLFETAPHRLSVTFNRDINSATLDPDDLLISRLPGDPPFAPIAVSYDASTRTATFTLASAPLADGNYSATLLQGSVTDTSGQTLGADFSSDFFFLRGDANRDGRVNLLDFNRLAANFGLPNRTFSQGDFNYDNVVNLRDFNILAARFGQSLVAPASTDTPVAAYKGHLDRSTCVIKRHRWSLDQRLNPLPGQGVVSI